MTNAPESEAVLAFIRERQAEVLAEAIRQLSTCTREDLPQVVHAISGSVGSYQLTEAHDRIAALSAVLKDSTATGADVESCWSQTLSALREMETSPPS